MQCGTLAGLSLQPLFGVIGGHLGPWSCGINQNFAPTKHVDGSEIRRFFPPGMYKALYMMVDKLATNLNWLAGFLNHQQYFRDDCKYQYVWLSFEPYLFHEGKVRLFFWFPHKRHIRRWIAPKKRTAKLQTPKASYVTHVLPIATY